MTVGAARAKHNHIAKTSTHFVQIPSVIHGFLPRLYVSKLQDELMPCMDGLNQSYMSQVCRRP